VSVNYQVSVGDAADKLGVTPARVRALIGAGALDAEKIGNRWLVSRSSVERRLKGTHPSGRSFTPEHAWALLLQASGTDHLIRTLTRPEQSRLRQWLRRASILDLAPRLRTRADAQRLRGHSGDIAALSKEEVIVLSGVSIASLCHFDIVAPGVAEFYASPATMDHLSQKYFLETSSNPNVIAHVVEASWPFLPGDRTVPCLVAALDLLEASDERTRRAGRMYFQNH
jgi:excisionase family DNA binding protein